MDAVHTIILHFAFFILHYCSLKQSFKLQATSKNYFLRIWAEDFGTEKVMEKTAYFVYGGFFITHLWGKRFDQIPKGEFLEVPCSLTNPLRQPKGLTPLPKGEASWCAAALGSPFGGAVTGLSP